MKRITVDYDGVDLATVMEDIGRQFGRNILVDPNVEEVVRVELRDIPWREAVDVIARMTRCEVEERAGGVLLLTQPPNVTIQGHGTARTFLQVLASYSGKRIVVPDSFPNPAISPPDIRDQDWREAIQSILDEVGDYTVIEEGDVLRVVPRAK